MVVVITFSVRVHIYALCSAIRSVSGARVHKKLPPLVNESIEKVLGDIFGGKTC